MARIRSIHPDQWIDEMFMKCTFPARLLALGVRNHADDNGIFKWDAFALKLRIFPLDDVDMPQLLHELVETRQVYAYEIDGKVYGIIRNFHEYQSPRKPAFKYPVPTELLPSGYALHRNYSGVGSAPVPHQYDTGTVPKPCEEDKNKKNDVQKKEAQESKTSCHERDTGTIPVQHQCGTAAAGGEGRGGERRGEEGSVRGENKNAPPAAAPEKGNGKTPPCPHQTIVDLYHEILPMCPKIRRWHEGRQRLLRARWKEWPHVGKWKKFFTFVSYSRFLTGEKEGTRGRKPFVVTLKWMLEAENFSKIIEGQLHDPSEIEQWKRTKTANNLTQAVQEVLASED